MEIGEPLRRWEVVPLSEPVPDDPAPVKEPERVPEKEPA
jgi:hypothetical protein